MDVLFIRHRACPDGVTGFRLLPFDWIPFKGLGFWQECLLEDSKDPPKTAGAVNMPAAGRQLVAPRGLLDASNRLKTPLGSIFLQCWGACASPDLPCFAARRPKRPPKRPKTRQDGFFEPTWAYVGANMDPCWH